MLHGSLLIDRVEHTFLLQSNAVLTSLLRIAVGQQTSDFPPSTVCWQSQRGSARKGKVAWDGTARCAREGSDLPQAIDILW